MQSEDNYLHYLKSHREVRVQHYGYFERLALLDGGTLALTANAVLGSAHDQIKHRYSLTVGVLILGVALVSLLLRNFFEDRREVLLMTQQYAILQNRHDEAERYQPGIEYWNRRTKVCEIVGVFGTIAGMALLVFVLMMQVI